MQNGIDSTPGPVIVCNSRSKFTFKNISSVTISGLILIGCTGNRFEYVDQVILESSNIIGEHNSKSLITIAESNMTVIGVSFLSNAVRTSECNQKDFRYFKIIFTSVVGTVGGALSVTHSNLEIDDCLFGGNSANIGGAIFSEAESNITINNTSFTSNYAAGSHLGHCSGGALFITEQSIVVVQNCNFQNNTSAGHGGVASVYNATLKVSQCHADKSISDIYGGVVAAFLSISLEFNCTTFNHSKTLKYGGALYMYTSNATISNSHFVNNAAAESGGAISIWKGTVVIADKCTFSNNSAR